jgi:hypothetical protein
MQLLGKQGKLRRVFIFQGADTAHAALIGAGVGILEAARSYSRAMYPARQAALSFRPVPLTLVCPPTCLCLCLCLCLVCR